MPAQGRAVRRRGGVLCAALVMVVGLGGCGGDRGAETGEPTVREDRVDGRLPASETLPGSDRSAAAHRGVRWLVENAAQMPPGWAYTQLVRVHRVVDSPALRAEIERALREDRSSGSHVEVPADLTDPQLLRPRHLTGILIELTRRRDLGLPYEREARILEEAIHRDEEGFWRGVKPTQQAAYAYILDEVGIRTSLELAQLIQDARAHVRGGGFVPMASPPYLYELTHLILSRSRYLQSYVDAAEFDFAIPAFRRALQVATTVRTDDDFLDVAGEVLTCFSLLRIPDDPLTARVRAHFMARQNEDGSWGPPGRPDAAKVHLTTNLVLALLEFPETLQPAVAYE